MKELYSNGELKKPYELFTLLPWMLAQDLNFYIDAHPKARLVLLIDEYERVFDEGGAGARWKENPFDAHLRKLVQHSNGLLAVFFSRERLPWADDPEWRDDLQNSQHLLGGLKDKDADDFLLAIPVGDAAIRKAIIAGARETSQPDALVYPLMLDLLVEHWRSLSASGASIAPEHFKVTATSFEGRRREILERVLRDYGTPLQTTLERLSVARRFDRSAFAYVVQTFGTALPLDQFDRIAELSFVTKGEDGFLTIHNAIAETICETLAPEKRRTSIDALFRHFHARARVKSHLHVTDETIVALIEASFLRRAQSMEGFALWLTQWSWFVVDAGRYSSATAIWREAASDIENRLGPDHPDTAMGLNNLALLLGTQGDLSGSRGLYDRALAITEKEFGPDHPNTAITLDNLALRLHTQGDLSGARGLHERALAIFEKTFGPNHPDTAKCLNSLALVLVAQGDLSDARALHERALAIFEKTLGPNHPMMAISLDNLARLLVAQGDLAGARPLHERAHAIFEKALGQDHPTTAKSRNNLALLLVAQGDLSGARPLFERALVTLENAYGPDNPLTAAVRKNLKRLNET